MPPRRGLWGRERGKGRGPYYGRDQDRRVGLNSGRQMVLMDSEDYEALVGRVEVLEKKLDETRYLHGNLSDKESRKRRESGNKRRNESKKVKEPAGTSQGQPVCFCCRQPGHVRAGCPLLPRCDRLGSELTPEIRICYRCGQPGHVQRFCPQLQGSARRRMGSKDRSYQSKAQGHVGGEQFEEGTTCYEWRQEGHILKFCPQGYKDKKGERKLSKQAFQGATRMKVLSKASPSLKGDQGEPELSGPDGTHTQAKNFDGSAQKTPIEPRVT